MISHWKKQETEDIPQKLLQMQTLQMIKRFVAEPISMSTPQMNYVNENSQSNMKEQRQDNDYNKWQFICRIYKRVCKCPWRLYVVFS